MAKPVVRYMPSKEQEDEGTTYDLDNPGFI